MPASAPAPSGITSVRSQRLREALAIAREHLDVGEQMMRERDRLRALQMRVAGHHGVDVATGERDQRARAVRATSAITSAISSRR